MYDNATGRLVGTEVKEDVDGVIFNTYWFPLINLEGVYNIKKGDEQNVLNADTIYINNSDNTIKSALWGLDLSNPKKSASRIFDIEFKTMYFYNWDEQNEEYVAVELEIPMLFIQEEKINIFETQFNSKNSAYLTGGSASLNVSSDTFDQIDYAYSVLLPLYDAIKDSVTYQQIVEYCKQ